MDQKTLYYLSPVDAQIGFLSNDSYYPFYLDNKYWPTVTHFITAKLFDGTDYEEIIRLAPTVYQVKRLVKLKKKLELNPNTGRFQYKRGYSPTLKYHMTHKKKNYLYVALREKFRQNKRLIDLLVKTYPSNLFLNIPNNPIHSVELERLRTELMSYKDDEEFQRKRNEVRSRFSKMDIDVQFVDLDFSRLTSVEFSLVKRLISLSSVISKMEGQTNIYPGIVEDALYNMFEEITRDLVIIYINKLMSNDWTMMYKELPNYINLYNYIITITEENDGVTPIANVSTALIHWWRLASTKQQRRRVIKKLRRKVPASTLILQRKKRWYRKNPPLFKKGLVKFTNKFSEPDNQKSNYSFSGKSVEIKKIIGVHQKDDDQKVKSDMIY